MQALIDKELRTTAQIRHRDLDHVNPEAAWPEISRLEAVCANEGLSLVERLTIYPRFVSTDDRSWIDPKLRPHVLKLADSEGLARDSKWSPDASSNAGGASVRMKLT